MPQPAISFKDFKGIRGLKIATLTADTAESLTHGAVQPFAGAQEVGNETEESTATKYYDNQPSIVTTAEGADTYSIITSVLDDTTKAVVEGRKYDEANKLYMATPLKRPYCALGFIATDTDDKDYYYWVLKGKFTGGAESHATRDDGTDTTNLEWSFNSIYTNKTFEDADNQPLKYVKVEAGGTITEKTFFAKVWTPDDLTPTA